MSMAFAPSGRPARRDEEGKVANCWRDLSSDGTDGVNYVSLGSSAMLASVTRAMDSASMNTRAGVALAQIAGKGGADR
jgi:hypothetical protein